MKKHFTFLFTLLFVLTGSQAQSVQQIAGLKLKDVLYGIIKNHQVASPWQ